jgi:hypothetical protein
MTERQAAQSVTPKQGDRVRITVEGEVTLIEKAGDGSGRVARVGIKAGRGMRHGIWLITEPGHSEVLSVEIVGSSDV